MLRKLGARPGESDDTSSFTLPNHEGFTVEQSADAIADYFAAVSQQFEPLHFDRLPKRVQDILSSNESDELPLITEFQVWQKMKSARVAKSGVHGDIAGKLSKEFCPELAFPV